MTAEAPLIRDQMNHALNARVGSSGLMAAFDPTKITVNEDGSGVTPTNYSYDPGDIRRYGGDDNAAHFSSNAAYEANNKAALQVAISVSASSGGVVVVPQGCDYGYNLATPSTWPDFSAVTNDVLVEDYSRGSSFSPPDKDGAQFRQFYYTYKGGGGADNGNGQWIRGNWHPYLGISNDAVLNNPSTVATDNRRASIIWYSQSNPRWQAGMGSATGAGLTEEQLCGFQLNAYFDVAPPPTPGLFTWNVLLIDRVTGGVSWNADSLGFPAGYHFKSRATAGALPTAIFEDKDTTVIVKLRTSAGSSSDCSVRNVAGHLVLRMDSAGDAVDIDPTVARTSIKQGLVQHRTTPANVAGTYTPNSSATNLAEIVVTTGAALTIASPTNPADGQQLWIKVKNTSGGAMGVISWSAVFKMSAWTNPANAFSRSILFEFDGTNWVQLILSTVDVPN